MNFIRQESSVVLIDAWGNCSIADLLNSTDWLGLEVQFGLDRRLRICDDGTID